MKAVTITSSSNSNFEKNPAILMATSTPAGDWLHQSSWAQTDQTFAATSFANPVEEEVVETVSWEELVVAAAVVAVSSMVT